MKTLPSINSAFYLEASLQDLHLQSREWLAEINFWKDEVSFFSRLLKDQHIKAVIEGKSEVYDHLNGRINQYKTNLLDSIYEDILKHERLLATVMSGKHAENERKYREAHRSLASKIEEFNNEFLLLKRELFIVMEDWP